MMGGMFKDVFDFLMLLILVLLGFTGALTTLFASDLDIEDYPGYIEVADSDCFVLMGRNSSFNAVRAQILTLTRVYGRGPIVGPPLNSHCGAGSLKISMAHFVHIAQVFAHVFAHVYTGVQESLRGIAARRLALRGVHLQVCTPGDLSCKTSPHALLVYLFSYALIGGRACAHLQLHPLFGSVAVQHDHCNAGQDLQ